MNRLTKLAYTLSLWLVSSLALAGVETSTDSNDVILAGHDAVAYFTEGKPVLGSANYTAQYQNAVYRFSSAKNRNAFQATPER
jgi:hypothetical protein